MRTSTMGSWSSMLGLVILLLGIGCAPAKQGDAPAALQGGWSLEHSVTKKIENYTFVFPNEGYAFQRRDSLVNACIAAIRQNMKLLNVETLSVPYRITFYPSKAAMKKATNIGVSGQADYLTKQVGFVSTDDPETVEKEHIIPAPITHETMHMVAMETWGYPPENCLWMNEGLATAAANSCNGRTVREVNSYLLAHRMTFPMDSLVNHFYACDEMIAYHQAACIVLYLLEQYGVEKLEALWEAGFTEFEKIYGLSFPELEARLNADVLAAYPDGMEIDWESFKKGCK